jgi:hypothetical protein
MSIPFFEYWLPRSADVGTEVPGPAEIHRQRGSGTAAGDIGGHNRTFPCIEQIAGGFLLSFIDVQVAVGFGN